MNDGNKTGNSFTSGLLLGALIGGAIVFLLGTKRGKQLLRIILNEGLDGVSKLLEKIDKGMELDRALGGEDFPFSEIAEKSILVEQEEQHSSRKEADPEETYEEKPKVKRFFRGISRRLN